MIVANMAYFSAIGFVGLKAFTRVWNPGPYYTDYSNALEILQSRINWVETSNGPRVYVTGILTNRSPIAWSGVEFECRFYNAEGNMVDVGNARGYLTVQPWDDSAFRAGVEPLMGSNDYRSFSISVSTARNSRSPF